MFVVLAQMALAQQRPVVDTNYVDFKGRKQGAWKKIDTLGLSYTGQFKDDKPYGRFTYFDKYGRTLTVSDFFRDGFATKTTHYYTNGKVKATGFYLDKLRDSAWQYYDTLGRMVKTEEYLNGMLHGLAETFDKNGNCIETQEWYRGLRNGYWWQWEETGTQSVTYKLNKSEGIYIASYTNGKPYIKGIYEAGLKEKSWFFYYDDGTLDRIMHFKNNQLIQKQVAIHVDGRDILLNTDSVAYLHTNGKIVEIKMLDGITYRPTQSFDKLVKAFDTDYFFLANPKFMAAYTQYDSLEMLPDEEPTQVSLLDEEAELARKSKRALLKLKIPTPYDVIVNGETIGLLQNITSSKPIDPE
jgi:antitoxin component YwqK of YwqJK toxin-antitoxin module